MTTQRLSVRSRVRYWLLRVIKGVLCLLPRSVAYRLADPFLLIGYCLYGTKRRNAQANVAHILRWSGDRTEGFLFQRKVNYLTKEVMRNFGRQFYDMMRMTQYSASTLRRLLRIEGAEHVHQRLREGRGALLVTAHFATWELAAARSALEFGGFNAVFLRHPDPGIDRFYSEQRRPHRVGTIPLGPDSFRRCQEALGRNEFVVLLGDIDYSGNPVPATLFGRCFMVPKGPALLALRANQPLLVGWVLRHRDNTFTIRIEDAEPLPTSGSLEERVVHVARAYLRRLEKVIAAHPSQWLCFEPLGAEPVREASQ